MNRQSSLSIVGGNVNSTAREPPARTGGKPSILVKTDTSKLQHYPEKSKPVFPTHAERVCAEIMV
jgi:hypothetical protein